MKRSAIPLRRPACTLILAAAFIGPAGADIQSGLVAYWKCDEGSGALLEDETAGDLSAACTGTTWADGKYGKTLVFNGSAKALVGNKPVLNQFPDGITIAAWIYRTADAGGYKVFISREKGCGMSEYFGAGTYDNNHLLIIDASGFSQAVGSRARNNQWYHYAATWDKTSAKIYIDGSRITETAISGTFNFTDANPLIIGSNSNNCGGDNYLNDAFTGRMDEIRLYNRALSAAEIMDVCQYNGATGTPPGADHGRFAGGPNSGQPRLDVISGTTVTPRSNRYDIAGRAFNPDRSSRMKPSVIMTMP